MTVRPPSATTNPKTVTQDQPQTVPELLAQSQPPDIPDTGSGSPDQVCRPATTASTGTSSQTAAHACRSRTRSRSAGSARCYESGQQMVS